MHCLWIFPRRLTRSLINYYLLSFVILAVALKSSSGSATTLLTDSRELLHEEITDWIMVSRGFPQGSGLSPLLFSIFVRNLPRLCSSPIFQFADDTTVVAEDLSLSVVAEKLKSAFDDVKQFCDSHELTRTHQEMR